MGEGIGLQSTEEEARGGETSNEETVREDSARLRPRKGKKSTTHGKSNEEVIVGGKEERYSLS